jgi:hypothetical protein
MSRRRTWPGSRQPNWLGDVIVWLHAQYGTVLTAGKVSQMTDISGNANHFTDAATPARRALYIPNWHNQRPAWQGDHAGTSMICNTQSNALLLGPSAERILVGQAFAGDPPAIGANNALAQYFGSNASELGEFINYSDSNVYDNFARTTRPAIPGHPAGTFAQPFIYDTYSAAGDWRAFMNGTQFHANAVNVFGSTVGSGPFFFESAGVVGNLILAEVILLRRVFTADERQQFTQAAGAFWGIPIVNAPPSISGLQLWVQANSKQTIATGVSVLGDQSGNGNNISQAVAGEQPTPNAIDAIFNNQPSLSFDDTASQFLDSGVFMQAQPNTYVFVVKSTIVPGIFSACLDATGGLNRQIVAADSLGRGVIFAGNLLTSATDITSPCILIAEFNGANSKLYVNSATIPDVTGNAGANSSNIAIGGRAGNHLRGKIAEAMCYNKILSAAEKQNLTNYLSTKYSIVIH